MVETLFEFARGDLATQSSVYSEIISKEFYRGRFSVEQDGVAAHLTLKRGATFPVSILSVESNVNTALRRGQRDIRSGNADVYAVWLLFKGHLRITDSRGTNLFQEGDIVITWPGRPGIVQGLVNGRGQRHHIIALVPVRFFSNVPGGHGEIGGLRFPMNSGDGKVVSSLINLLHAEGHALPPRSASTLFQEALQGLERLCSSHGVTEERGTIIDRRLHEIESFIDRHISDVTISAADVSSACKISRRYLYRLLNTRHVTFAEMLWEKRREQAKRWLGSSETRRWSIGEIAARAGFKSLSHFSESFKRHFGITPTAYRKQYSQPSRSSTAN